LIRDDEVRASFGTLLRGYRSASGLTQQDLAERSGVSIRAIADMERGRTTRPFRNSVYRLADALELRGAEREQLENASRSVATDILWIAGRNTAGAAGETGPLAPRLESGPGQPAEPNPANGRHLTDGRDPGTAPRLLPPPVADFVGRKGELQSLCGALARPGPAGEEVTILAIVGTAGVGKTALALRWAHQAADRFPDGQLYVNLRGFEPVGDPLAPADVITGFLHALGQSSPRGPLAVQAAAGQYRSLMAGRRMLIVLDNARDPEQVRPLLPGNPACTVVVTSRNQFTGLVVADGARQLFLDVLSKTDAFQMLARRLGPQRLTAEPLAAQDLIGLSAGLPLVLAAVAAHAAASPSLTLRDLAADLRDSDRRLDAVDTGEPATSLRALLSGSYRRLPGPAARMLRLVGTRSDPEFSSGTAASLAGIPVAQARALLRELARSSLLTEHPADRFTCHAFVHSYAAELASPTDNRPGPPLPA
jgi:transcriptional regulator with XRE-family HTH domain